MRIQTKQVYGICSVSASTISESNEGLAVVIVGKQAIDLTAPNVEAAARPQCEFDRQFLLQVKT